MLDSELALLGLGCAFGAFVWRFPEAGLGFVLSGNVVYFGLLHIAGLDTSGPQTGIVFAAAGCAALVRLLRRPGILRLAALSVDAALFLAFVAVWYVRWFLDDPVRLPDSNFVDRAPVFMVVFASVPFLCGLAVRDVPTLERVLRWTAVFGGLGAALVGAFWLTGQPHVGSEWAHKWEPIRNLTGIVLSLDLGVGCLAFWAVTARHKGVAVAVYRWAWTFGVVAIAVRVGQRGPFAFLLVALVVMWLIATRRPVIQRVFVTLVGAVAAVVVAMSTAEEYSASRAVDTENYGTEANENRLDLLAFGFSKVVEKPIWGWGRGLVGTPTGRGEWQYSHSFVLDPLIETGLLGFLPFLGVMWLAGSGMVRGLAGGAGAATVARLTAPLVAYTLLEAHVSGHVSWGRAVWFLTGVLCATRLRVASGKTVSETPRGIVESARSRVVGVAGATQPGLRTRAPGVIRQIGG